MVLAGAKNIIAVTLLAIGYLGQQLVWFEGNWTSGTDGLGNNWYNDQQFFNVFVADILFAVAIALEGVSKASAVIKTIGVFFFVYNVEAAVCLLPPRALAVGGEKFPTDNEYRAAYVGGVLVLITTFLGFALSLLRLISIPAGLGSRIGSLRGLGFLFAILTSLVTSFIAFSYEYTCPSTSQNPVPEAQSNAVPILFAWIFLSGLLVGDAESVGLSVFFSSIGVLYWKPIFDPYTLWPVESHWHGKWRAQDTIAFSGFAILLAATVFDRFFKGEKSLKLGLQTVVDFVALGIGIAGAVSAYTKNPQSFYSLKIQNYEVSYAIVITGLNFFAGLFGHDGIPLITTFFASYVLTEYDTGSTTSTQAYNRGGLQLCALGTLLSITFKVFPVAKIQEGFLVKAIDDKGHRVAALLALAWATVSAIYVPNDYSKYLLIAIITYGALTQKDHNWARTTFFIVGWYGVVRQFPLAVSINYTYVKAIIFIASAAFAKLFHQDFDAAAAPGFGSTSDEGAKEPAATTNA